MAQFPNPGQPPLPPQKSTSGATIFGVSLLVFIAGLAFFCLCIVPICAIVILSLMGPAIGNVFSDIIDDLITPTPSFILESSKLYISLYFS
jgi:hypothetical protein